MDNPKFIAPDKMQVAMRGLSGYATIPITNWMGEPIILMADSQFRFDYTLELGDGMIASLYRRVGE